jgi:hypothetical protein
MTPDGRSPSLVLKSPISFGGSVRDASKTLMKLTLMPVNQQIVDLVLSQGQDLFSDSRASKIRRPPPHILGFFTK